MTNKIDLAALLGSRICHDLISPIGAIGNGVELMMMKGGTPSPELQLITESVAAANARIRFFRIAFGLSGGEQRLSRNELAKVLADNSAGGRLTIDWQPPSDIPRGDAKLAFLAILCCESALAYGGRITITLEEGKWLVAATADRLRIDDLVWDSLSAPNPDIAPAQVHFALFAAEIAVQKRRLITEITQTSVSLHF
ncbi:histidine phosphotransferase ChpT [Pseudorhodobacter antarcticus]|jgi:histidine phosphotransferase ChpT|uniref:Histidine phosphotransferase ChpT n=1 Tax=Pseudorhodobacter antarcticus TaxID=1077947 RepID=A0A1H8LQ25_9RHOB|nr:histidine phosphotransferase family protein [Pseudorhodobacter antarcticus]SEO07227.1 histidine phosphotransferase ChpT [Pseudorhodobacter antarcticus]